eukprot:gnl/Dysnectes_brevis/3347_a4210_1286.p1 GENE.gnl/Dysnectes_brevis/3347_a4210_1286~~gnl/Dysnectes_brevis/3347_a4210_1286.p1  ORF type:complete len:227 (-),score=41.16 gnl/Dysnectes_brevis/3347_a4210_1286:79-759(-)
MEQFLASNINDNDLWKTLAKEIRLLAQSFPNFYLPIAALWPQLLEDYSKKIQIPMSLSEILESLSPISSFCYRQPGEVLADILLVSNNAFTYNEPSSPYINEATQLQVRVLTMFIQVAQDYGFEVESFTPADAEQLIIPYQRSVPSKTPQRPSEADIASITADMKRLNPVMQAQVMGRLLQLIGVSYGGLVASYDINFDLLPPSTFWRFRALVDDELRKMRLFQHE